jgi:hypothetical protein
MKPWQKAAFWLARHFKDESFEELLASYFHDGYVFSSPTSFILFGMATVYLLRQTNQMHGLFTLLRGIW